MKVKSKVTERYPFNSSGLEEAKLFILKRAKVYQQENPLVFRLEFVDHHGVLAAVIEYRQRPPVSRGVYGNQTTRDYSLFEKMASAQASFINGDLHAYNLPSQDFRRFRQALESRGFHFEVAGLSNKSLDELKAHL